MRVKKACHAAHQMAYKQKERGNSVVPLPRSYIQTSYCLSKFQCKLFSPGLHSVVFPLSLMITFATFLPFNSMFSAWPGTWNTTSSNVTLRLSSITIVLSEACISRFLKVKPSASFIVLIILFVLTQPSEMSTLPHGISGMALTDSNLSADSTMKLRIVMPLTVGVSGVISSGGKRRASSPM